MQIFGVSLKDRLRRIDPILFWTTFFLSVVSIVTVFGAVDNFGKSKLIMQCAMTAVGSIAVLIFANMDYRFFVDRFHLVLFFGSALLLAVTLVFGSSGENIETANRSWLRIPIIGIAIQPSEFVKIAFLFSFSRHIDRVKDKINKPQQSQRLVAHIV